MKDIVALHQRIAELETENAALKAQLPQPDQSLFKCEFCPNGRYEQTGNGRMPQMGCGSNPKEWRCNSCNRNASEFRSQRLDETISAHRDNPLISTHTQSS